MEPLPDKKVSFEEYRSWTDEKRWEVIDGHPYAMSGASVVHQEICSNFPELAVDTGTTATEPLDEEVACI